MAAKLLEGVVKSGWEVVSSAEFTTTPGFELVTWVFKKSVTPIGDGNGAVVALMLTPPNRSVMHKLFGISDNVAQQDCTLKSTCM